MENISIISDLMTYKNISTLIAAWPTRAMLASDLGLSVDRVHKWAQSGTIPARYQLGVLEAATRRAIPLTADELVRLNACDQKVHPPFSRSQSRDAQQTVSNCETVGADGDD